MISRQQQLHHLDKENPSQTTNRSSQFPTKTPLRQQSSFPGPGKAGLTTNGKGKTGGLGTVGRRTTGKPMLGNKDGNLGKNGSVSLLFTAPTKSNEGASTSCAFQRTPSSNLPIHLRTPSPAIQKLAALTLTPGLELEFEVEEEEEIEEEYVDREVEGASGSSANYDAPFEPEFEMINFKEAKFGKLLRHVPMRMQDDDWRARDEEERAEIRAELNFEDDVEERIRSPSDDESLPAFPMPKRRALATKSINASVSSSSTPRALARKLGSNHGTTPLISDKTRTAFSSAKPTVSKPKWGAPPVAPTTQRRTLSSLAIPSTSTSTSTSRSRLSMAPPATKTSSIASSSKPLNAKVQIVQSRPATTQSIVLSQDIEEEERSLGIYGIVERDDDLLSLVEEVEVEEFQFDV